jgi:hypothetical protein
MTFTPKIWDNPGTALTDLETRIKVETDALEASVAANASAIAAIPAGKPQRTARVAGPAMAANTAVDVVVTWPTPFADANYTVNANVAESISTIANGVIVRQIRSKDANGCVVRISNGTQVFLAGDVTLHAIAIHD